MEQKVSKKSKKAWSVMISVHGMGIKHVGNGRTKKPVSVEFLKEYMHTNVTKMFKEGGMLIVVENKLKFRYDMSRIVSIQVREHKRMGIQ